VKGVRRFVFHKFEGVGQRSGEARAGVWRGKGRGVGSGVTGGEIKGGLKT